MRIVVVLLFALVSMPAAAQATRTWVSGVGNDNSACSRTQPCKTFAGAIERTAAGGEINCLDPGGFGPVTITKSITIDCGGALASILAGGGNAINVNDSAGATPGTIVVRLRGLSLQGNGVGGIGVNALSFRSLTIEDCTIDGFDLNGASAGIAVVPINGAAHTVTVLDATITNNRNGVRVFTSGVVTAASVVLSRTSLVRNTSNGVIADATSGALSMTVRDSLVTGNTASGVATAGTFSSDVNVVGSTLTGNATGVTAGGTTAVTVRLSGNAIVSNNTGVNQSGATLVSLGNNTLEGNGSGNALPGATPLK